MHGGKYILLSWDYPSIDSGKPILKLWKTYTLWIVYETSVINNWPGKDKGSRKRPNELEGLHT